MPSDLTAGARHTHVEDAQTHQWTRQTHQWTRPRAASVELQQLVWQSALIGPDRTRTLAAFIAVHEAVLPPGFTVGFDPDPLTPREYVQVTLRWRVPMWASPNEALGAAIHAGAVSVPFSVPFRLVAHSQRLRWLSLARDPLVLLRRVLVESAQRLVVNVWTNIYIEEEEL